MFFYLFLSQEVLVWLTALQKELGGEVSDEKMRDYIWNTLKSGRVKNYLRNLWIDNFFKWRSIWNRIIFLILCDKPVIDLLYNLTQFVFSFFIGHLKTVSMHRFIELSILVQFKDWDDLVLRLRRLCPVMATPSWGRPTHVTPASVSLPWSTCPTTPCSNWSPSFTRLCPTCCWSRVRPRTPGPMSTPTAECCCR